jgi:hypothetical protein
MIEIKTLLYCDEAFNKLMFYVFYDKNVILGNTFDL